MCSLSLPVDASSRLPIGGNIAETTAI